MVYYFRRRPFWRRRYRFRPWRARKTIYRRRWRHRRVRRKRPYINLKQYQPACIRNCHIKGLECAVLFNQSRISNNSIMYKESYVPESVPGGGGFTVMKFTLYNLYTMHQNCFNWWTNSNKDLPLCRYLGCKLTCYQSLKIDYVLRFTNNAQAISNKLTYPSTQPSMMMMMPDKYIIPSRQTQNRRKPYTKIFIKPPKTLQNKWYFQKDLMNTPLLVLYISATSLQQQYIDTTAENNNITIHSINTTVIRNHNFTMNPWPYKNEGTTTHYLYYYAGIKHITATTDLSHLKCAELIPLTNIKQYTSGSSYYEAEVQYHLTNYATDYCDQYYKYTGHPFTYEHLQHPQNYLYSTTGPQSWSSAWKALNKKDAQITELNITGTPNKMTLGLLTEHIITSYRYNPFKDDGKTTQMYLLKCDSDTPGWDPPSNPDIILEGFPLWLNIWGYTDFQIKLGAISSVLTNTLLVIKSKATDKNNLTPIVPLSWDYLSNKSPFEDNVNPLDAKKWYPQLQYQLPAVNDIALTGPGTPKHPPKTSDQVTIKYDFFFKWGGEPAKMTIVSNPQTQPTYPLPRDECTTNSLQSPAQAIETGLYSFDQRYNQLTKAALERITQDWDIKNYLSSITETTGTVPAFPTFPQAPQEKETQEKEKETLFQQLLQHRDQQQQLRLGILQLMKQLDL
nr:MAG: ORF1 [TTV-like mini virus]